MKTIVSIATLCSIPFTTPVFAQDIGEAASRIGQIERGFWTRPVGNHMQVDDGHLVIDRSYRTIVEWAEPGVPSRWVTDTLQWRLPLETLQAVSVSNVAGDVLLEGGDQDSYCPLTVARFSCETEALDCADRPQFFTCRYNQGDLMDLLEAVKLQAPNLTILTQAE